MIDRAEEMLSRLVLIRSTSEDPAGPMVDHVSSALKDMGLTPRLFGDKAHPAIIAQHMSGGVLLSGHLDTVPHGTGWRKEQAEVVSGVMYGRGTCDMKGGCTAMLLAAEKMVASKVPFSLVFTLDEETTMDGAAAAVKDEAVTKAPAVLVTEPTKFEIVVREKGLLHFSVSTKGKSAHASMPHLGENAIAKMVELLSKIEDLQRIPAEPLDEMTLCVDTIKGGTRINVIPADCEVEIDVRYPPEMNTQSVLKLVKDRMGPIGYEVKILHELDPVETDPKAPPVRALKEAVGRSAKVVSVPYATEMVVFKAGNPVQMVCGPGDPKLAHAIDEHIRISDVVKATELYVKYCTRMAPK